jgi:hypothetical protein
LWFCFSLSSLLSPLSSFLRGFPLLIRVRSSDRRDFEDGGRAEKIAGVGGEMFATGPQNSADFHKRANIGDRFGADGAQLANLALAAWQRNRKRPVAALIEGRRRVDPSNPPGLILKYRTEFHLTDILLPKAAKELVPQGRIQGLGFQVQNWIERKC